MAEKGYLFPLLLACYLLQTLAHYQSKYELVFNQHGNVNATIEDLCTFVKWHNFLKKKLPMMKNRPKTKNGAKTAVIALLLIMSGDVEANPGPTYMCQVCKQGYDESVPGTPSLCQECHSYMDNLGPPEEKVREDITDIDSILGIYSINPKQIIPPQHPSI